MKKLCLILLASLFSGLLYARHIRGGELYYTYLGPGSLPNTSKYSLVLKLYIDCTQTAPGQRENQENVTIFTRSNNVEYGGPVTLDLTHEQRITYDPNSNPCIGNPPQDICYDLRFFELTIELPDDPDGYTLAFQRCCRVGGIQNLIGPTDNYGATYTCDIPGTNVLPATEHNSSPVINGNDAVAICTNSSFKYDFSAVDPDGDSLVYSLCDAYLGAGQGDPSPMIASTPPYTSLPYNAPFTGGFPLGLQASINPATGIITGIAPSIAAQYVVTACIYEYRHGILINVHRKDIHLRIADCIPLKAALKPDYHYCDDFLTTFKNEQSNPAGSLYIWNYGDGTKPDTSMNTFGDVQHQYADTGTYTVKLTVILAGQCVDSTTTLAKVYPGFYPGFIVTGSCFLNPIQFNDTTKTKYGTVNKWQWDFGDETTTTDVSQIKSPSWKYNTLGTKTVTLIVESDKGCIDTVSKDIQVKDKPTIGLAFKDTLICSNLPVQDTLLLQATGLGVFSWTPNTRIINANTATPSVFPTTTTKYVVQLDESGCINTDTVTVRVVDHVTLDAGPDSTICLTDTATLHPIGDGLAFVWQPDNTLSNPNIKNPIATPVNHLTTYTVTAKIGKCSTTDNVTITTIPYPGSNAGPSPTICYSDTAQLQGTIVGSSFTWTPTNTLINANTLTPRAFPTRTTTYYLIVYDTLGCPKPGIDTVTVNVERPVIAFAGNDTAVVVGQPLQLNATGATNYLWSPPANLNRNNISSPVATFNNQGTYTYIVKVSTALGCFSYDTINIKVFDTAPEIFVPNAFTPDRTENNVFRPIPVGISKIDYFRVYNRWGQMVFSGFEEGRGWDGTFAGKKQDAGTYVWTVQGTDFTGKVVKKKGTVILIR